MSEAAPDEELESQAAKYPSPVKPAAIPEENKRPQGRVWWLATLAALVAGLVAFAIGEMTYKIIPAQKVLQSVMMTNAKVLLPTQATENVATTRNAALAFGVLGLCLGGALGIAGGVAQRSPLAAARGGLVGAVLSLALGASLSLGLLPWFLNQQTRYSDDDLLVLIVSLVMHALIWGVLGACAGLALVVGLENLRLGGRALVAGFVGAVVGTVAFELIGGLLFPLAATHQPISETWPTRLMARLLVTLATAGTVILVVAKPRSSSAARQTDSPTPVSGS